MSQRLVISFTLFLATGVPLQSFAQDLGRPLIRGAKLIRTDENTAAGNANQQGYARAIEELNSIKGSSSGAVSGELFLQRVREQYSEMARYQNGMAQSGPFVSVDFHAIGLGILDSIIMTTPAGMSVLFEPTLKGVGVNLISALYDAYSFDPLKRTIESFNSLRAVRTNPEALIPEIDMLNQRSVNAASRQIKAILDGSYGPTLAQRFKDMFVVNFHPGNDIRPIEKNIYVSLSWVSRLALATTVNLPEGFDISKKNFRLGIEGTLADTVWAREQLEKSQQRALTLVDGIQRKHKHSLRLSNNSCGKSLSRSI